MTNRFAESDRLRARAHELIPGGAHTYSKGDDQFPELAPGFIARGLGSHVWDVDGNEFIDWGMGLRSVVLGHAYEPVLRAVREALERGSNFVRPSPIELELAEQFVATIPSAQMVKFAKNGSDVTTAAVKLARAFTGRDLVVRCQDHPFYSIDDWFIGDTACDAGVPDATKRLTKRFAFNDLASVQRVFDEFPGQVACVITEAATRVEPAAGFLQALKSLCHANGALLILDEMITGFRWHNAGAQAHYGIVPDLSTFGKAVGNGFACSALVGRRDVMEIGGLKHDRARVFLLSTTHGGETHALAAAGVTLRTFQREPVVEHLWRIGRSLSDGFNALAKNLGIAARVKMDGPGCSPYQVFLDDQGQPAPALLTLYHQEMIRQGVLIPYIAPAYQHSDEDVSRTVAAASNALKVVAQAIDAGTTDGLLVGRPVRPVFRKFNG